jgi:hypothetical protein
MRTTALGRTLLSVCGLLSATWTRADNAPAADLLTEAELASLERENGMWRLANPDQGLAANIARLKEAGYTEDEIAALQPRLVAMWTVPFERNFGWLRAEAVERVRAIDREFVARMRAAQLYQRTGVRTGDGGREDTATINRLWRVALTQALANDELAEFQLMNSTAARQESRLARGLTLTADEQRTLFEWRRDYDGRKGPPLSSERGLSSWQREMFLDQCRRLRDLLGDVRFAVYFSRANPGFDRMRAALEQSGAANPTAVLDVWWMRAKELAAIDARHELTAFGRAQAVGQLRDRASNLLGEAPLKTYLESDDGRWLDPNPPHRRTVVKPPKPRSPEAERAP